MKYSRKEPRDFIPFEYGEVQLIPSKRHSRTIWKNIETVTSWLQNKILHDPGQTNFPISQHFILALRLLFPDIPSFSKISNISGNPSKHPKSFSVVSKQVEKLSASVFPRSLSAADILRLCPLIR